MTTLVSSPSDPRLICALDVPSRTLAEGLAEQLGDAVASYKIGLELLATGGVDFARDLRRSGKEVFADWKLHDIGATVERAMAAITASEACDLVTVHALPQVMAAAVRGRGGAQVPKILAVTVLTSLTDEDLAVMGYSHPVAAMVERRIRQSLEGGVDGVVSSPHEAALARRLGGPEFLVVTPGVRPAGADHQDQARAATPAAAIAAGASRLVVGRPITASADPRGAAQAIVREIRSA